MHILVLGYGQTETGCIDEQTKDRCKKAIEIYRAGGVSMIHLTASASKNGVSMAKAMQRFLITNGVPRVATSVERRGANTAGEMDIFLSRLPYASDVTFVSTWYHIPRIIWLALWRSPWQKFSVGIAWRHAHFKADVLVELLKIANAIIRPRRSAKFADPTPAL